MGVSFSKLLMDYKTFVLVCMLHHFLQELQLASHSFRHPIACVVHEPLDVLVKSKARNPACDLFEQVCFHLLVLCLAYYIVFSRLDLVQQLLALHPVRVNDCDVLQR